jgi:crotonobetainyl-CoA:carnitine CoA-transferase CaiB-like acyl-CoA transferase
MSSEIADYTLTDVKPQLNGNRAVSLVPTADLFQTGDGYILLAVNFERQVIALMKALGLPEVLADPRFSDELARRQNEQALRGIIEEALAAQPAREWEKILNDAGAPCASIWGLEEVIDHPQLISRQALHQVETPLGPRRMAGLGFKLAHGEGRIDRSAPRLSQHTEEVLVRAGYSAAEIARLRAAEVV